MDSKINDKNEMLNKETRGRRESGSSMLINLVNLDPFEVEPAISGPYQLI